MLHFIKNFFTSSLILRVTLSNKKTSLSFCFSFPDLVLEWKVFWNATYRKTPETFWKVVRTRKQKNCSSDKMSFVTSFSSFFDLNFFPNHLAGATMVLFRACSHLYCWFSSKEMFQHNNYLPQQFQHVTRGTRLLLNFFHREKKNVVLI